MRDAPAPSTMTVEYLRFDERSPVRHEFVTGEVYAMSGATARHDLIAELETIPHDPCVVIEVTSAATARIDRGEKLDAYGRVESLRAYLIVDHRRRRVERHWRSDAIYRRVELRAVSEPEGPGYDA